MNFTRGFTAPLLLLVTAAVLPSCAHKSGSQVLKFKSYHLRPHQILRSEDPSIPFERKHLLYGAVTSEEKQQRYGNYLDFFWKVKDRSQAVTLNFEYFQTRTGSELKTAKPVEVAKPKGYNKASYRIIGDDYVASGPVMAWKFSVVQGGQEVAKQESYLWDDVLKQRSGEAAASSPTTIGGAESDLDQLFQKGQEALKKADF